MRTSPCSTFTLLRRLISLSPLFLAQSRQLAHSAAAHGVELLASETTPSEEDLLDSSSTTTTTSDGNDVFPFDKFHGTTDLKHNRLARLCKELPNKARTLFRTLNAQKKWMRQEDATSVVLNCMRIRENETAFRVYKWMIQQRWYRFDFALATELAVNMGKERKFSKCREIFDDIINQGRVPSESTFHILIVAYLSASAQGCLDEACIIYNRMIQLGGYQACLSLHNTLFKALVSKPGNFSKQYIKQAEFIYHNLVATGLDVHKDTYEGLIWLHSYEDTIDKERIAALRKEMQQAGIEEGIEVLISILRACVREGDVSEAEKTWLKLPSLKAIPPCKLLCIKWKSTQRLACLLSLWRYLGRCRSNKGKQDVMKHIIN